MSYIVIGDLLFGKRPGTDDINGSVTVEYLGNVPIELMTVISISGATMSYPIVTDTRTWNPGDPPADIIGSILTPSLPVGSYDGICEVIRTDTSEVLATAEMPNAIEVMQRKILGHVKDWTTTIPIGVAEVKLLSSNMTTLTDGTGYFEFVDPPASGIDTMTVTALGYAAASGDAPIPRVGEQQQMTAWMDVSVVSAEITNLSVT